MSVSEKRYGVFTEEDFDFTYEEEIINNLKEETYPVSSIDLKKQIRAQADYQNNGLEGEEVEVEDLQRVDEILDNLRQKNRQAKLDGEFAAYVDPESGREFYTITT